MARSSHLDTYLAAAAEHGWTVHTYLHHTLHGAQKRYSGGYYKALQRALNEEVAAGRVETVASAGGGTAYLRTEH